MTIGDLVEFKIDNGTASGRIIRIQEDQYKSVVLTIRRSGVSQRREYDRSASDVHRVVNS